MAFTLQPATGENFIDRKDLLDEIISRVREKSTTSYALYGKRRVGKTSILKEIERRLKKEKNIVPVYFSVWDLIENSILEFCRKLSVKIIDNYRPYLGLKYKTKELLKTPLAVLKEILAKSEFKIIYNEIEFLLSLKQNTDKDLLIENTFNLAERLSKKTNLKCILLIDEFPSIIDLKYNGSKVGELIIKKIRTMFESWKRTSLCISGSIRTTMGLTVLSSSSPFYRQLIVKEIRALEKSYIETMLSRNLKISRDAIDEIYEFSSGIPFYVQFIGKLLEREKTVTKDSVKEIEDRFLKEEGNLLFKEEFETLSSKEKIIIISISRGFYSPSYISKDVGENISNINRFLIYLEEKGFVSKKERGKYSIDDPVFEKWLKLKD